MFPYDPDLVAAVEATPQSIADVVAIMQNIDSHCINGDGLKWFNLLYMQVTQAVEARVNASAGGSITALDQSITASDDPSSSET